MRRSSPSSRRRLQAGTPTRIRDGFTLMEMLVVAAVLVVLLSLMSTLFTKARAKAMSTQSAANLRALAEANLLYAVEHDGRFCPAQDKANLNRWHGARTSTGSAFDATRGYLSPYLGDGGKARVCPLFAEMDQSTTTFERGAGGYGYNAAYIGGTPESPFVPELVSRVVAPSRTIMFTDAALPRGNGLQEYPFSEPFCSVNPNGTLGGALAPSVHFRHDGFAHVAWCDGSVSAEAPSRLGGKNLYGGDAAKFMVGWVGPAKNNGWWNARGD